MSACCISDYLSSERFPGSFALAGQLADRIDKGGINVVHDPRTLRFHVGVSLTIGERDLEALAVLEALARRCGIYWIPGLPSQRSQRLADVAGQLTVSPTLEANEP